MAERGKSLTTVPPKNFHHSVTMSSQMIMPGLLCIYELLLAPLDVEHLVLFIHIFTMYHYVVAVKD